MWLEKLANYKEKTRKMTRGRGALSLVGPGAVMEVSRTWKCSPSALGGCFIVSAASNALYL